MENFPGLAGLQVETQVALSSSKNFFFLPGFSFFLAACFSPDVVLSHGIDVVQMLFFLSSHGIATVARDYHTEWRKAEMSIMDKCTTHTAYTPILTIVHVNIILSLTFHCFKAFVCRLGSLQMLAPLEFVKKLKSRV